MGAQRAVKLVELFAAGGFDGQGQPKVFAAAAGALAQARIVPIRVEMAHDHEHGVDKAVDLFAHDFDGEITGIFNQAVGAGRCHKRALKDRVQVGSLRYFTISGFAAIRGNPVDPSIKASLTADKSTQTAVEATSQVDEADDFRPLTAQEAQAWRERHPTLSVWRVVGVQLTLAVVLAMSAAWIWGRSSIAFSLMYGAFAVVLPSALFARGMTSRLASVNAVSAALSFAVWQGVKMVLTVLLLALAPKVLNEVSWPALLVGLLLTMKVYWLALAWGSPKKATPQN